MLSSSPAWATHYYVDALRGNDQNNGTSSISAWRTIARVNRSHFAPGDSVLFKRGDIWREQLNFPSSGASNSPIVIDAYGSGPLPIISGADLVPGHSWLPCRNCPPNVWQAIASAQPNVVIFDGLKGNQKSAVNELVSPRDWFWTGSTLYVHSQGPPAATYSKTGIESGSRPLGIDLTGLAYVTVQNIEVSGANAVPYAFGAGIWGIAVHLRGPAPHDLNLNHDVVVNGAGDGIHLEGAELSTVDSCEVSYNENAGIELYRSIKAFPVTSARITNNKVHHNHFNGITILGCPTGTPCRSVINSEPLLVSGLIISGNKVYANGAGIYLHETNNSLVSGNASYANTDTVRKGEGYCVGISGSSFDIVEKNLCSQARVSGIELSVDTSSPPLGSSDDVIRYNVVHDDGTQGLFTDYAPSHHNKFLYNIIYNHPNGACIMANYTDHEFYNNTCVNNREGLHLYVSATTPETGNITVKNNIFVQCMHFNVLVEPGVEGPLFFDRNEYYPDGPSAFRWLRRDINFSGWQASSSQDADSFVADPQLSLSASGTLLNLTLPPGSPAIGRGADLGPAYREALLPSSGWPDGVKVAGQTSGRWDVGAFLHAP